MKPKQCPVCGNNSIRPVTRSVLVKLQNKEVQGVIAYRCGKGHLFLVGNPEKNEGKKGKS